MCKLGRGEHLERLHLAAGGIQTNEDWAAGSVSRKRWGLVPRLGVRGMKSPDYFAVERPRMPWGSEADDLAGEG